MAAFRHPLRVRFSECDPQGVVFNGNYLNYFDIAVGELWREALGGWQKMVAVHNVDAVVAEATMKFLKPLHYDEDVELLVGVADVGNTSMKIGFAVERGGERCAEGENRYVYIDTSGGGTTPVPGPVSEALSRFSAP